MKVLVLNLPLPPPANNMFVNVAGKGRVRSGKYKRWSIAALKLAWLSKPQGGFPLFDGPFNVQISVPTKMRGDVDGRIKAIPDFLKKPAGIITDDKHMQGVSIARDAEIEPGFCRVFVYEAKEAA